MKYKDWKEEFYSTLIEDLSLHACCRCYCGVEHPFLHWLKYHRSEKEE